MYYTDKVIIETSDKEFISMLEKAIHNYEIDFKNQLINMQHWILDFQFPFLHKNYIFSNYDTILEDAYQLVNKLALGEAFPIINKKLRLQDMKDLLSAVRKFKVIIDLRDFLDIESWSRKYE